jgi:hypothetical protein
LAWCRRGEVKVFNTQSKRVRLFADIQHVSRDGGGVTFAIRIRPLLVLARLRGQVTLTALRSCEPC